MLYPAFPLHPTQSHNMNTRLSFVRYLLLFFFFYASLICRQTGNSRRPEITQTNLVDIYLFHGDSNQQVLYFPQVTNPTDQAGYLTTPVNDTWFGSRTANEQWSGGNISLPFYWVLISSNETLDGSQRAQPTFQAVRAYH